jgi:hypothetical protein
VGEIYKARLELTHVRPSEEPTWKVKTVKTLLIAFVGTGSLNFVEALAFILDHVTEI